MAIESIVCICLLFGLLISLGVMAIVLGYKNDKRIKKYCSKLNEHDKAVILDYINACRWMFKNDDN